jgi:hypothetical protein
MQRFVVVLFAALAVSFPARAEEGMWTFNDFPSAKVKQQYGFEPSPAWLEHLRLSSIRLAGGCSASLVSAQGLVLTNHHCARSCIEQLSTAKSNLNATGFFAKTTAEERRCPAMEANQLVEIKDVSAEVFKATQGLSDQAFHDAQKAEFARLEKACATSDSLRCDVVTLYRGGQYHLYKYRRFQDVRLVFAPEEAIAFFGGDPDNFMFPRYDLDLSFLRLYDEGKPFQAAHHFEWSPAGVKEGELTFVTGHPGGTSRQLTVAQLEMERDLKLPRSLMRLAELRGWVAQFRTKGPEQSRIGTDLLFGVENGFKALKGEHEALLDKTFFASKVAAENALRAKVKADPKLQGAYGGAWDAIANANEEFKRLRRHYSMLEGLGGFSSDTIGIARTLVRAAAELPKPNEKRLREWSDSKLPGVKQRLFSEAPIYDELEELTLTFSLTKLREELGPDNPVVQRVLGMRSPSELAKALVKGTKLKDVKVRKALFEGGQKAIDASKDPLIALMKEIEPDARALRTRYEEQVESVVKKASEQIARANFLIHGTGQYPDATFTLRLSYGQVKGYEELGQPVPPFTYIRGAFNRHTGRDPFALPKSWLNAKAKLDPATPFNFASTNDIIGGNSGSPVVNQAGQLVGLVFDGNIQSLGGEYGFDPAVNRAVSVDSRAIMESLDKVYGAKRLIEELKGPATQATPEAPPARGVNH